ncbi:MAG: trypsin-like peptidase domain-containing protein [Actinomycetota bacterium]|nr:trypsin-like peptidase domain-containing protein [Actinomycetota bacterium]
MGSARLAAVTIAAAVLGGLTVLLIGRATNTLGETRTVVIAEQGRPASPVAVRGSVKPLLGNGFAPAKIYAARAAGVVTVFAYFSSRPGASSQGSGFVVSPQGYLLTNSHVITDAGEGPSDRPAQAASRLYVEFSDHDRVAAEVVGWDVFDDVGVLKVDPADHPLHPVPLGDSARIGVGDPVAAIGSPLGNETSLAVGVVSARRRIDSLTSRYSIVDAIQTDAPITHGNSGGPLFDGQGRVVGINAQIDSQRGGNDASVGFAIPIDAAKRSMRQLIASGRVSYGYAGIETEELTPTLARHFRLPVSRGAVVTSVAAGTPAARAGIRGGSRDEVFGDVSFRVGGDVLVAIDGAPVGGGDDVVRAISIRLPGQTVTFTLYRDGRRRTIPVKLGARPLNP